MKKDLFRIILGLGILASVVISVALCVSFVLIGIMERLIISPETIVINYLAYSYIIYFLLSRGEGLVNVKDRELLPTAISKIAMTVVIVFMVLSIILIVVK